MDSEAIPAATLILLRESDAGPPELLMVERSQKLAFAPGALVFPGGRIDSGDVALSGTLGLGDRGARIAAIRETIEECGVAVGLEPPPSPEQSRAMQQALLGGEDFASILAALDLEVHPEALTPFARWVPGHEVSRRFDTIFYIAWVSSPLVPHLGSAECVSVTWISAAAALESGRQGNAKLIYPTRKNLERLAQFSSVDAILDDARSHPVEPVTAELTEIGGETFVTIPEGLGYPVTRDLLADVWRG
jgi:8-oxo-dGTP pyrophosphatase MutT (NUDIX family)